MLPPAPSAAVAAGTPSARGIRPARAAGAAGEPVGAAARRHAAPRRRSISTRISRRCSGIRPRDEAEERIAAAAAAAVLRQADPDRARAGADRSVARARWCTGSGRPSPAWPAASWRCSSRPARRRRARPRPRRGPRSPIASASRRRSRRADRRWRSASCCTRRSRTIRRASASSARCCGAPKCGRRRRGVRRSLRCAATSRCRSAT